MKNEMIKNNLYRLETPVEIAKKSKALEMLEEAGLERYSSRAYVAYWLVFEGKNANNVIFTKEELEDNHKSIRGTMINNEHYDYDNIGVNLYSKIDTHRGKTGILVLAAFDKGRWETQEILDRHQGGTLRFSMECYTKEYECEKCGAKFPTRDDGCEHFLNKSAGAYLKGIEFRGSAMTLNPAEKKAASVDIAKKMEDSKMNDKEMNKLYEEKAKLSTEVASKEKELSQKNSEIDNFSKEVASLKEDVATKEEKISELEKELETASKELEEKTAKIEELEKANRKMEREKVLSEAGITVEIAEKINLNVEESSDEVFNAIVSTYKASKESASQVVADSDKKKENKKDDTKETETASKKENEEKDENIVEDIDSLFS